LKINNKNLLPRNSGKILRFVIVTVIWTSQ